MEIEFRVVEPDTPGPDGAPKPLPAWARIRAEADMPSMPSMPKFDQVAHYEGIPGVFGVHPVFPHGGDYRLCLTIQPPDLGTAGGAAQRAALTFDFPLTVQDAEASPAPAFRKVRPFALELVTIPRRPLAGQPVDLDLTTRMVSSFERREVTDFE